MACDNSLEHEAQTPEASPLRIIAASEVGQLRVCEAPAGQLSNLSLANTWGTAERARGVEALAISLTSQSVPCAYIAAGLRDGGIEVRSSSDGDVVASLKAGTSREGDESASICGLHFLGNPNASHRSVQLLSCSSGGLVCIHAPPEASDDAPQGEWQQMTTWQGPAKVHATAFDLETAQLAFGCEGSELSVWDVTKGERTYLAKGAKPNPVGLMDKPWTTAVAFVPGSRGRQLLTGTGQHKVRLYTLSQRRPLLSVDFGASRITALAPSAEGQKCWVADSQGQIGCLDLQAGKVQQGLKGVAGSVRSLTLHADETVLVSAGLDRYLRVHNLRTRKPVARVFLKHQLTGAVICPRPHKEDVSSSAIAVQSNSKEVLQEQQLPDKKKKKAKRRDPGNVQASKKKSKS